MSAVVLVLAVAVLVWVLAPLRRPERDVAGAETLVDEAEARKRAALAAIVDLEDDRSVGKLAEEDMRSLRHQYEAEALAAIAELDALATSNAEPDELEAEIARMREAMRCPSCGATRAPNESCPRCGAG